MILPVPKNPALSGDFLRLDLPKRRESRAMCRSAIGSGYALLGGVRFSLGFMKSCSAIRFGSAGSCGSPGAGGAMRFADPAAGIGYAYVTSKMGTTLTGDPRDVALREALYAALRNR